MDLRSLINYVENERKNIDYEMNVEDNNKENNYIDAYHIRNQKNNMFIGLDINKLKNFMRDQKYHFDRTEKDISSIKNLLTSNINKSKLNLFKRNRINEIFPLAILKL